MCWCAANANPSSQRHTMSGACTSADGCRRDGGPPPSVNVMYTKTPRLGLAVGHGVTGTHAAAFCGGLTSAISSESLRG